MASLQLLQTTTILAVFTAGQGIYCKQANIYRVTNIQYSCTHYHCAVVNNCIEGDINIVQDTSTEIKGFVQYCQDGEWRRVCQMTANSEGSWNLNEATVTCRQLGYSGIL